APGVDVRAAGLAALSDSVVKARCVDHEIHRVLKPATWFADLIGDGEPGRGFQHAMDFVINTSRLYNAVGSAGAARRAYLIAWTYAKHRRAFGSAIKNFPLVPETPAEMRPLTMAVTSGRLYSAPFGGAI